jgi:hypothetical protein
MLEARIYRQERLQIFDSQVRGAFFAFMRQNLDGNLTTATYLGQSQHL